MIAPLPRGREPGSGAAQRLVEWRQAALNQEQDARLHKAVGAGEHQLDCVLLPRPVGPDPRTSAPEVDHEPAVLVRREGRAE